MNVEIKCTSCKQKFSAVIIEPNKTSSEEECSHCGEWNYWVKPKVKAVAKPQAEIKTTFKKGQSVRKTIYFQGKSSGSQTQKIHSIVKGTIYLSDQEGQREEGITYNLQGSEIENFFSGFTSKIKAIK